jgi:phosphate transport system substrate-binding protein
VTLARGFSRPTLGLVLFAAAAAAFPADRAGAAMNEALRGAGSTFSAALYKQWIETYHQDHPQVSITYNAVGSGEGVRRSLPARSILRPPMSP